MKYILILLLLFSGDLTFAQTTFPAFLNGTWKMENQEVYEHWDKSLKPIFSNESWGENCAKELPFISI